MREKQQAAENHDRRNPPCIYQGKQLFPKSWGVNFVSGKAILKLYRRRGGFFTIRGEFISDIKVFCECGQCAEDDELQEDWKAMNPVAFGETNVVSDLANPDPPNQSEEEKIWNACLNVDWAALVNELTMRFMSLPLRSECLSRC